MEAPQFKVRRPAQERWGEQEPIGCARGALSEARIYDQRLSESSSRYSRGMPDSVLERDYRAGGAIIGWIAFIVGVLTVGRSSSRRRWGEGAPG